MRRVLVTGASGFIGSHCLPALLARGFEVHAVSRRSQAESGDVVWHQADLLKASDRERVLAESMPSDLLHGAWEVTAAGAYRDRRTNHDWLSASAALFESAIQSGVGRVLALGTCWEYDVGYGWCREFQTPLRPSLPYSEAKEALGRYILAAELEGVTTAWGRIFFSFGPGDRTRRLVPSAVQALLAGEPFECSQGSQIRDFVYVEDLADAIAALLASAVNGPVNLASGVPRTLRSIVEMIASELGRTDLVRFGRVTATGLDAEPMLAGDVRRLTDEVGWRPSTGFEEGIRRTIAWWQNQPVSSNSRRLA